MCGTHAGCGMQQAGECGKCGYTHYFFSAKSPSNPTENAQGMRGGEEHVPPGPFHPMDGHSPLRNPQYFGTAARCQRAVCDVFGGGARAAWKGEAPGSRVKGDAAECR